MLVLVERAAPRPAPGTAAAKLTAGSTKPVIAANGMASRAGDLVEAEPDLESVVATFRSQKRFWMTIVISSGKRSARCLGMSTPAAPVLKVM